MAFKPRDFTSFLRACDILFGVDQEDRGLKGREDGDVITAHWPPAVVKKRREKSR